jgi:hypothetical protein
MLDKKLVFLHPESSIENRASVRKVPGDFVHGGQPCLNRQKPREEPQDQKAARVVNARAAGQAGNGRVAEVSAAAKLESAKSAKAQALESDALMTRAAIARTPEVLMPSENQTFAANHKPTSIRSVGTPALATSTP